MNSSTTMKLDDNMFNEVFSELGAAPTSFYGSPSEQASEPKLLEINRSIGKKELARFLRRLF